MKSYEKQGVIIIPAYEPDYNLIQIINEIREERKFIIIVVNDGSLSDKNIIFKVIQPYVVYLEHKTNLGKGAAIKTALDYIKDNLHNVDSIVTMDADGQHLISDMKKIYKISLQNSGSLILGSRNFSNDIPIRSQIGNKLTKIIFRLISGTDINDTQTGLRAFDYNFVPLLVSIEGERYEYEMNMLLKFSKEKIPIEEVPISTIYKDKSNSSSHFNIIADSIKIYAILFKYIGSSFFSFVIDYICFIILMILSNNQLIFSNISARFISATVNYHLNRKYVFKSNSKILSSLSKYILLAVFTLIMNTLILDFFSVILDIPDYISKIITELILFFMNITIQKFYIFKEKKGEVIR